MARPPVQRLGVAYIDAICRDEPTPQRIYATQDANLNVTGLVDDATTCCSASL